MLAGEYAVLEPNYELIVLAVDRFVYGSLTLADANTVSLENYQLMNIPWSFAEDNLQIATDDSRKVYVECAMEIALTYLRENNITWQPFSLAIRSELDDEKSGRKYGLGSSAAVTVTVISVILEKFAPSLATKEIIFKLAAITHIIIQGNGSGADIAASTYGGVLAYKSFQAEWLKKMYEKSPNLTELVESEWKYLHIEPLEFPINLIKFAVGWTGQPASTGQLVAKILQLKETNPKAFSTFLRDSAVAVEKIKEAIITKNKRMFFQSIDDNHQALATLGKISGAPIETQGLRDLANLTKQVGGAGKLSGAGGGDCGLAFASTNEQITRIKEKWRQANIAPLSLQIHLQGVNFS